MTGGTERLALLGCGALGGTLRKLLDGALGERYTLCAVLTRSMETAREATRGSGATACDTLEALLACKPDVVVEVAGVAAVRSHAEAILRAGVELVIVSIGALADGELTRRLERAALEGGSVLRLASGAIGGLDVLRAMALAGDTDIAIDNIKAPQSLEGAPYLRGEALPREREQLVFSGSMREAIEGFPGNVNVAVAAALAAGNPDGARVMIHSEPGRTQSRHVIRARNQLANVTLDIASSPDTENPRSSIITAYSVAALLMNRVSPIRFG